MDDVQETLDVDVAVDTESPESGNSAGDQPQEPFLVVNERQKYLTREDAIKGIGESGKRISELAPWEKTAKQYGLSDPKHLESIFNETLELRKAKAELEALKKMQATLEKPKPAANDPKAQEAEQVKKYLAELGYTSKADVDAALKELKDQVAELNTRGSQTESTRFENQEAEAREWLSNQLSEAKIVDDETGTKANIVGTLVKQVIESSDDNLAAWNRGGSSAQKIVKSAYEQVLNTLGWKPAGASNASAAQAASVGRKLQNGKTLPQQGTAKNAAPSKNEPARKGLTPDLRKRALAYLEKLDANA